MKSWTSYELDAYAIRCWMELQDEFNISPCVLVGELCDRGIAGACEVDIANAVVMHTFELASDAAVTLLDWNNNYGGRGRQVHPLPLRPDPRSR